MGGSVTEPSNRPVVVVVGGGPAALEVLLTLSERLTSGGASLCLVAPNRSLTYRPLSSVAEFATHSPHALPLEEVAARCEARLIHESVVLVEEDNRRLLTHDGQWILFDQLVLAVGAQEIAAPDRWSVWRSGRDPSLLRELADEIARKQALNVAVVVPAHAGWPLAGFELALILGWAAKSTASAANVWLLASEQRPLAVLGAGAEAAIDAELGRAGVKTLSGVAIREPPEDESAPEAGGIAARLGAPEEASSGSQPAAIEVLVGDELMSFDRLVTLPANRGPGVHGLAVDERGYIRVDDHGRVLGSERVWAAGDCTASVVKHSTLAVAQADAVADALAAALGAPVRPQPFEPCLRGIFVTGAAERWWAENMTLPDDIEPATHCLWWPPGGVVGGRLAHHIAGRDPSARPYLLSHPGGMALSLTFTLPAPSETTAEAAGAVGRGMEVEARHVDAYDRQLFALHRLEREAERKLGDLEQQLAQQQTYSRQVLQRLSAGGYISKVRRTSPGRPKVPRPESG